MLRTAAGWELASRKLQELGSDGEPAEIDAEEAQSVDQRGDFGFRELVVTRIEQHAPAALGTGVALQQSGKQVVERLDHARARHQVGDDGGGSSPFEVGRLELGRFG
jgi:hypothetical protein